MKILACPVCGEEKEVDDRVEEVICAECLITGEAPLSEDGVQGYSPEAFLKLVSVGIDNWKDLKSEEAEEKKLIRKFNNLREKKVPLINVQKRMDISWKKAKKLEAYRLLQKGWTQNKIAKELKVNQATISRWYMHFRSTNDVLYDKETKTHITNPKSRSNTLSSPPKNPKINRQGKSKIQYNISSETLKIAKEEGIGKYLFNEESQRG